MLSKKTQYALQALAYMVEHQDATPILIAEIATKKNIPIKFLENILLELKKEGKTLLTTTISSCWTVLLKV